MSEVSLNGWMKALIAYVRSGEPDLTNRQMALLMLVYLTPGPHTVRGLARVLGVSKPVITRALNTLGALGYLRRERDQDDRRNVFVVRTSSGAEFLEGFKRNLREGGTSAAERPVIAGVYCNRLRIGMKLDADPTVIYPVTKGKPLGRRILRSELNAENEYNTYRRSGLPEGPIANPGKASIAAVLHPAPTKALYFVADGTGGHVFAETLAQQNANVARWFAIRRARGQM